MQLANITINEMNAIEHVKAIDTDNYNVSRSCEDHKNNMQHMHNCHELLFVEDGSATYFIEGKPYFISKGDILVVTAMHKHKRVVETTPFLRYGLTIKPSYFRSLMLENEFSQVFETPNSDRFKQHYKNIQPEIFSLIINQLRMLKGELLNIDPYRGLMERNIITQLTLILYRLFGFKPQETPLPVAHTRALDIKDYINVNFKDDLSLKVLADKFYMHPVTISKYFHKYCGKSLIKYINLVRVSEAAKLLESTNDSIMHIAQACGYDNDITLSNQFKSHMGVSPAKYRKNMIGIAIKMNNLLENA